MPLKKEKRNMVSKQFESQITEFKTSWRDEYLKWKYPIKEEKRQGYNYNRS